MAALVYFTPSAKHWNRTVVSCMKQIGPIVGKRTVQGFVGGGGKSIRIRVYDTFRQFVISRSRLPDPGVGQQVGRTGYSRTDEAAEGMKNMIFSV
jgi:hypothetical protein